MSGKILLVEDEHSIAEPVIYNLKQEGFSVTHVDEGQGCLLIGCANVVIRVREEHPRHHVRLIL